MAKPRKRNWEAFSRYVRENTSGRVEPRSVGKRAGGLAVSALVRGGDLGPGSTEVVEIHLSKEGGERGNTMYWYVPRRVLLRMLQELDAAREEVAAMEAEEADRVRRQEAALWAEVHRLREENEELRLAAPRGAGA